MELVVYAVSRRESVSFFGLRRESGFIPPFLRQRILRQRREKPTHCAVKLQI